MEFASPVDYVEPVPVKRKTEEEEPNADSIVVDADEFIPFTGSGNRCVVYGFRLLPFPTCVCVDLVC